MNYPEFADVLAHLNDELEILRKRNDYLEDLVIMASEYKISPYIHVQERGKNRWAVFKLGEVLNADGEWEFEPSPSSRDEEFLERTRFDRETAITKAKEKAYEANKRSDPGRGSPGEHEL